MCHLAIENAINGIGKICKDGMRTGTLRYSKREFLSLVTRGFREFREWRELLGVKREWTMSERDSRELPRVARFILTFYR